MKELILSDDYYKYRLDMAFNIARTLRKHITSAVSPERPKLIDQGLEVSRLIDSTQAKYVTKDLFINTTHTFTFAEDGRISYETFSDSSDPQVIGAGYTEFKDIIELSRNESALAELAFLGNMAANSSQISENYKSALKAQSLVDGHLIS